MISITRYLSVPVFLPVLGKCYGIKLFQSAGELFCFRSLFMRADSTVATGLL